MSDQHDVPQPAQPDEPPGGRWLLPGLSLLAILAALAAFWALGALSGDGPAATTDARPTPSPIMLGAEAPDGAGETQFRGFVMQPERPAPDIALTDGGGEPWTLSEARGKAVALFFGYTHCPDVCPQTMAKLAQGVNQLGPAGDDVVIAMISVDPDRDTPEVVGNYVANFHPEFVGLTGSHQEVLAAAQSYGVYFEKELPPEAATEAAMVADHSSGGMASDGMTETEGAAADESMADHAADEDAGGEDAGYDDAAQDEAEMSSDHAMSGDHDMPQLEGLEQGTSAYTVAHSGTVFLIDRDGQLRSSLAGLFTPDDVAHDLRVLLE